MSIIGAEWIEREARGPRIVFSDDVYIVTVGRYAAAIAEAGGADIHVPRGHAYFDLVCEANDRRTAEDLYAELAAALA
ncbi:hypothetical protein J7E62_15325 [Variovorax paradoxus]|nr:hypothetical protein [Variovorax paradoxus]